MGMGKTEEYQVGKKIKILKNGDGEEYQGVGNLIHPWPDRRGPEGREPGLGGPGRLRQGEGLKVANTSVLDPDPDPFHFVHPEPDPGRISQNYEISLKKSTKITQKI